MKAELPEHTPGTGNVFADIGVPDAETNFLKAQLVSRLDDAIRARGVTQTEAAKLMGIAQPDLSNILRGKFRGCSVERLLRFLAALGCEVEIVVRPRGEPDRTATIPIRPVPLQDPSHPGSS